MLLHVLAHLSDEKIERLSSDDHALRRHMRAHLSLDYLNGHLLDIKIYFITIYHTSTYIKPTKEYLFFTQVLITWILGHTLYMHIVYLILTSNCLKALYSSFCICILIIFVKGMYLIY